jgi:outer membrane receptor protein involved in Fe transport
MYQGFNDPNPDLVPERLRSAELVVEQRFGRGWIAGSLFRNRIDDLIVLQTDAASGIQKHFNLGQAEMRGLELEAGLTGGAGSLRANLTWQRALFREPGVSAELPNAPRVLANLLASTPQQRVFGVPLRWGAEFKYLGSRLSDPGDARVAGDRVGSDWWANLTATAAPTRTLEVQLQISNVFDRSIEHVVGTEYDESFPALMNARMPTLVQDGRSARVTGRWNF